MLFVDGQLSPESIPDPRIRAVLGSAAAQGTAVLRPGDLLASVIRQGHVDVLATLARALRPG